jgi:hypothetical protein
VMANDSTRDEPAPAAPSSHASPAVHSAP